MIRACYRFVLWLHPLGFRRQFADEMLWIFDQAAESQGAFRLFLDGLGSLARQWLLRTGCWKAAAALALALLQVAFGMLLFGRRRFIGSANDPSIRGIPVFANHGALAHQPLTLGIVMYLALFVTGGLFLLIMGLNWWLKNLRRRPAVHRVR